jgi:hypothetical protein
MKLQTTITLTAMAASIALTACSKDDGGGAPQSPQVRVSKASGISCDGGFTTVATESIATVMVAATERQSRDITLRSSSKYGFTESSYNLSANCFVRKGDCEVSDQLMYNHGGDGKSLQLTGHFIVLDDAAKSKYGEIDYSKLDALKLMTKDGTPVSQDTIFGNPSTERKLVLGESYIDREYDPGSVILALVDDTWNKENYQLFKIKINKVVAGEEVSLSYQRIAEAPKSELRNFYCSKQAEFKKNTASKTEGEVTIYGRSYGGYPSSTFGFDYGVNGFDGRFVRAERVMSFGDGQKCSSLSEEMCVTPYVGWVVGYWGGVVDLGDTPLADVKRSSWPNLQSIDPKSAASSLKINRTYLISQLNDTAYTFGAIRITEIDSEGRWVKFNWKRVAIETPSRFVTYTNASIPANEASGETTLTKEWWTGTHFDVALAKRGPPQTEAVFFDAPNAKLYIDNRYFPTHSGIVDVTGKYANVDVVPLDAADRFVNQYKRDAEIKVGSVYVVVTEKFWYRATLAVQVTAFVPGESVTLKYRRLYNGQTFPGRWYKE